MALYIHKNLEIPDYELWITTSRAGGPGGQHVNKTSSKVTLNWSPADSGVLSASQKGRIRHRCRHRINKDGVLHVDVAEHRSQHRNREIAEERMAEIIRQALERRKKRKRTRPTRGSVERRLKSKKIRGEKKQLRKTPKIPKD